MKIADAKGDWALVTGASSGIGEEYARQLVQAGMHVVLVARRKERLDALAGRLRTGQTQVLALDKDLARTGAVDELRATLAQQGIRIRLLCNIAGVGRWGRFEHGSATQYQEIMVVNMVAPVVMCYAFLPDLESFASSAVINVSSPAVYQPVPYMGVYAASKSFVHQFSQALHGEWAGRGILVQTLVPGPTVSEFDEKAGAYESALTKRDPAAVAVKASLAGLDKGLPVVVSARGTLLQRMFGALAPPSVVIRKVAGMFRPPE
ncbi:SDR family NAD(P)-dependent oxidoreductase [Duganella callida]|uniref:SDR family NAD(P)-dependent oxidoreductase n=1 Tax=Duganella callida TaxID=2561932 RepID=A0A4Y9SE98_9BURK|nr:SDR family NAD(P)-dependent oxidoreductase [Duganella callida]TFW19281.1 SDR family NAD(P)-dependent oxidoreductase [Duganella callida]